MVIYVREEGHLQASSTDVANGAVVQHTVLECTAALPHELSEELVTYEQSTGSLLPTANPDH